MAYFRLLPSAGAAIVITTGIGLAMAAMIRTEFQPQESVQTAAFEINPIVDDIKVALVRKAPKELLKVEVPPPPPSIDKAKSDKPKVNPTTIAGEKIDWIPPDLDLDNPIIEVVDADPQPLVRIPPVMPPRADRSGHCNLRFSVGLDGSPFDISAISCSQKLFESASVRSVAKWKYRAKIANGRPVIMRGLESRISFNLTDENDVLIPE